MRFLKHALPYFLVLQLVNLPAITFETVAIRVGLPSFLISRYSTMKIELFLFLPWWYFIFLRFYSAIFLSPERLSYDFWLPSFKRLFSSCFLSLSPPSDQYFLRLKAPDSHTGLLAVNLLEPGDYCSERSTFFSKRVLATYFLQLVGNDCSLLTNCVLMFLYAVLQSGKCLSQGGLTTFCALLNLFSCILYSVNDLW